MSEGEKGEKFECYKRISYVLRCKFIHTAPRERHIYETKNKKWNVFETEAKFIIKNEMRQKKNNTYMQKIE